MVRKWMAYGVVVLTLIAGVMIYLGGRDAQLLRILQPVSGFASKNLSFTSQTLPAWIINNGPDGLWMMAFSTLIISIWNFSFSRGGMGWYLLSGVAGLGYELGQLTPWIPGTFDPADLIAITVGFLLAGLLFIRKELS